MKAATAAPRWFVVDDESMIRNLAELILRRFSDADVQACADAREALALAERSNPRLVPMLKARIERWSETPPRVPRSER